MAKHELDMAGSQFPFMKQNLLILVSACVLSASISKADNLTVVQARSDAEQLSGIKAFVVTVSPADILKRNSEELKPVLKMLQDALISEFQKTGASLLTESQYTSALVFGHVTVNGVSYTKYEIASYNCFVYDEFVSDSDSDAILPMVRQTRLSLRVQCPNPRKRDSDLSAPVWESSFIDVSKRPGVDAPKIISETRDMLMRYHATNINTR